MNPGSDQRVEPSPRAVEPPFTIGLAKSVAELLSTEFIVATGDDGWSVPLLRVADKTTLPVFTDAADLPPELPPRCAEWQRVLGHELVAAGHTDQLYIHPTGEVVSIDELRRPTAALVEAAQKWHRGSGDQELLLQRFQEASVYCEAGDRPGLPAYRPDGSQFVPIFTTLERFVRSMGNASWFSTTGNDLLELLPAGLDLVLDPGTPHSCRLPRISPSS